MATALAPIRPATAIHLLMLGGSEYTVSLTTSWWEEPPELPVPFSIMLKIGFRVHAAVPIVVFIKLDEMLTIWSMIS